MRTGTERLVADLAPAIALGLCLLGALLVMGLGGSGWSSSAAPWLEALALPEGGPAHGAIGRVVRDLADGVGVSPSFAMRAAAWLMGLSHLALLTLAAWRCLGYRGAWLPLALALLWPASRQAFVAVSAEGVLATATLLLGLSALGLLGRPRLAALGAAVGLLLLVLAHPMGLPVAGGAIVILALWPRPQAQREVPAQGFGARPIWTAWLAALLLTGGLLLLARPDGGMKLLWTATLAAIRPTATTQIAGGLADLPLIGPLFGMLARTPPAIALLGAAMASHALGRAAGGRLSPFAAFAAWWLIVAALLAHPTPGAIDPLAVIAPLVALLTGAALHKWLLRLWRTNLSVRLPVAAALTLGVMLSIAADGVSLAPADPRTGLAHATGMVADPAADLPAVLLPADLRLLVDQPASTAILPGLRDGNRLAMALARSGLLAAPGRFYAPFSTERVLLHLPPGDPISAAWHAQLPIHVCVARGTRCLLKVE